MTRLILASQSIGRKKLLEQLKIPFTVIASNLDEEKIVAETPLSTLKLRAKRKGEDVADKVKSQKLKVKSTIQNSKVLSSNLQPTTHNSQPITYLILSADSGAILDNELIGKPKDYDEAVRILKKLSGRTHEFVTAVYIIKLKVKSQKLKVQFIIKKYYLHDSSFVTFRKLSDEDIKRYLSIIDYTKFAGGYALYSGQDFITNVKGSLSNVIGLPIEKIIPVLSQYDLISYNTSS